MEQAIWGGNGLSGEVGLEGGETGNLGWIWVNLGSGNGKGRRRQFWVEKV